MLERYFAIRRGERQPGFLELKSVETGVADLAGADSEDLWDAHDRALSGTAGAGGADALSLKAELARRTLASCRFCERRCGVDRTAQETGYCGVDEKSWYVSEYLHVGEEPELVPSHTVFFAGCTFACVYCQNWDIATSAAQGRLATPSRLAGMIDSRCAEGARNVNFVGGDPTPHLATVLETLTCVQAPVPVVWNSNMYLTGEALCLLQGAVDVYLADFRYGNDECARRYSDVPRYWEVVTRSFEEADAQAEVMLRHLVLPGHLHCCTEPIMAWCAEHLPGVYFNLMFQYRPCNRAHDYPGLDRRLTTEEMAEAAELAETYGFAQGNEPADRP